jgi:hypothetical protein
MREKLVSICSIQYLNRMKDVDERSKKIEREEVYEVKC